MTKAAGFGFQLLWAGLGTLLMESTKMGALPYFNTGIRGYKNHQNTVFHCIRSYWWLDFVERSRIE
jgi:hypothetical protein